MPLYDYHCEKCGYEGEHFSGMNEYPGCPRCGKPMIRLLHARFGVNMGPVPTGGYYDDNLGKFIGTNAERKREMERQGVTEKGATPKPMGAAWV